MESDRKFKSKKDQDEIELEEHKPEIGKDLEDYESESFMENELDIIEKVKKTPVHPYQELIDGYEKDATKLLEAAMKGKFSSEQAQGLISAFRKLEKVISPELIPQMKRLRSYLNFDIALAHLNAHSIQLFKNEDTMPATDFLLRIAEINEYYNRTINEYLQLKHEPKSMMLVKITLDHYPELKQSINMHETQIIEPKQIDKTVYEIKATNFLEKLAAELKNIGPSSFLNQSKSLSKTKKPDDMHKLKHTLLQEINKNKSNIEKLSSIRAYLEEQQSLCKILPTREAAPTFNTILQILEEMPKLEDTDKNKEASKALPIEIRKKK